MLFNTCRANPARSWTVLIFHKMTVVLLLLQMQMCYEIVQLHFEIQRSILGDFRPATGARKGTMQGLTETKLHQEIN